MTDLIAVEEFLTVPYVRVCFGYTQQEVIFRLLPNRDQDELLVVHDLKIFQHVKLVGLQERDGLVVLCFFINRHSLEIKGVNTDGIEVFILLRDGLLRGIIAIQVFEV